MPSALGTALVLGGGENVWDDIDRLEELMGEPWPGAVFVCNDMGYKKGHNGRVWDRRVDHWATLHAEKLGGWQRMRKDAGLPGGFETWSSVRRTVVRNHFQGWTNGSSGLYAVSVALKGVGHPRVILCGIPMDRRKNSFSGREWASYSRYVKGWTTRLEELRGRVRSLSGWTRATFGAPSIEWIGLVSAPPRK